MIRINLLPRDDKSHREVNVSLPKVGEFFMPVAVLAVVGLTIGGMAYAQHSKLESLKRDITQVEAESRALAPQIERVNQLAQERAELDLRIGITTKLQHGRTLSVKMVDEAARCMPDHLWLVALGQQADGMMVEGATFSNLVVSEYMTRLERSPLFAGVELEFAEKAQIENHDIVKFRISCRLTPDDPAN